MADKGNSLQAVLERKRTEEERSATGTVPPKRSIPKIRHRKAQTKRSREGTTLIGGHFPRDVGRQLAIIAAEEGATKQALLTEALDMLFTKKGKTRIAEL